jgi:hypothetical protein
MVEVARRHISSLASRNIVGEREILQDRPKKDTSSRVNGAAWIGGSIF